MIESRATYISFFYNEYFNENCIDKYREELVIYAVTHKKKAFLSLIRNNSEIFSSLPYNSLLFQKSFYSRVVNINTLNVNNLKQCRNIKYYPEDVMKLLSARIYTFEEISVLQELPVEYAALYSELQNERVDDRLKVMREIIKRKCLRQDTDISSLAAKLSLNPLSKWMQTEFVHVKDLDADVAVRLLEKFDKIRHLINDIKSVSEARYVASNAEIFSQYADMDSVRNDTLERDQEWLQIAYVVLLMLCLHMPFRITRRPDTEIPLSPDILDQFTGVSVVVGEREFALGRNVSPKSKNIPDPLLLKLFYHLMYLILRG